MKKDLKKQRIHFRNRKKNCLLCTYLIPKLVCGSISLSPNCFLPLLLCLLVLVFDGIYILFEHNNFKSAI